MFPLPKSLEVSKACFLLSAVHSLCSTSAVFTRESDQRLDIGVLNFRLQTQVTGIISYVIFLNLTSFLFL